MAQTKEYREHPDLTDNHVRFCKAYVVDYNGTRAYGVAYPTASYDTCRAEASKLLKRQPIKDFIEKLKKDIESTIGLSKIKVLQELSKVAFSSVADLHDTWITRKEFEALEPSQKAAISEIKTRTRQVMERKPDNPEQFVPVEIEEIHVKLYDKLKAIESISKMMGYNEPEELIVSGDPLAKYSTEELKERAKAMRANLDATSK